MENRYWEGTGLLQAEYDEMENAGHEYTKETERLFHSYYRYFNDGDLPGWARSRWDVTQYTFDYGYMHRELTKTGEDEFERRLTARIEIEYHRFKRTRKSA